MNQRHMLRPCEKNAPRAPFQPQNRQGAHYENRSHLCQRRNLPAFRPRNNSKSTKSKTEKSSHRKSSAATAPAMALPDCFRKAASMCLFVAASAGAQSTRSAKQASRCMQAPQALPTLRLRLCLQGALPRSAKQPATAATPIRTAATTTAAPATNNANPPDKCLNQLDAPVKCS